MRNEILQGDVLERLNDIPDQHVQCVMTSPPYWGLRDYGTAKWDGGDENCDHSTPRSRGDDIKDGDKQGTSKGSRPNTQDVCFCGAIRKDKQLGLEKTPEEYIENMVKVFRGVKRCLRDDGTVWLNLGDSYSGSGMGAANYPESASDKQHSNTGSGTVKGRGGYVAPGLKPKDLVGIPWRVALALQQPYYTGSIKREQDRIWLASMIDGEGCMFIHKRKAGQNNGQGYVRKNDSYGAGLEVANTHESIVRRCLEITGKGSICHQDKETKTKERKQRLYRWNLRSNECRDIVREIYPYLVGKQHEARLLIGCPSSGKDAEKAHKSLIALHNGREAMIDFPKPNLKDLYEPGWYLRSDVIWSKLNPMPESVTDRPTKSHEYIFLLSKNKKYYYDVDAVKEPVKDVSLKRAEYGWNSDRPSTKNASMGGEGIHTKRMGERFVNPSGRNLRDVWTITTQPYPEAHFATFPEKLVEPCIKAGSKVGDIVLDPFLGSGTVASVAKKLRRNWLGIELNPAYIELAKKRINSKPEPML